LPGTYWIGLLAILTNYALLTHVLKRWFVRRFGLN
jgi:Mg2+-importing ATPase